MLSGFCILSQRDVVACQRVGFTHGLDFDIEKLRFTLLVLYMLHKKLFELIELALT